MVVRTLAALFMAPIALACVYFGDIPLLILILITTLLASQEFFMMLFKNGYKPNAIAGYVVICAIIFSAFARETASWWTHPAVNIGVLAMLGFSTLEIFRKKLFFPKNAVFATLRVALFFGFTMPFVLLMRAEEAGLTILSFCLIIIWTSDSFALIGGKLFGKNKLAPSISPKKTIEGSISAVLFSMSMGGLLALLLGLNPFIYIPLSLVISVLGQIGDLHESLTKRFFQVKDSSNLIPGHGGVYDRGDSAIFVIPVVYYLIQVF